MSLCRLIQGGQDSVPRLDSHANALLAQYTCVTMAQICIAEEPALSIYCSVRIDCLTSMTPGCARMVFRYFPLHYYPAGRSGTCVPCRSKIAAGFAQSPWKFRHKANSSLTPAPQLLALLILEPATLSQCLERRHCYCTRYT